MTNKGTTQRDSDEIIWQLAEKYDDNTLLELHKILLTRNLFIPSTDRSIQVWEMSGMKVVVFYTGMHPSWGGTGFCTVSYKEALDLVLKMNNVDGMLLHNKQKSWVGFDKKKVLWLSQMGEK
jgi:hypothetical protein